MKASFYTESILYSLAKGLSAGAQKMPPRWNAAFGRAAGTGIYHLLPKRRAVALSNLRAAFGDTYTPQQYQKILKELFQNLGMQLMEVAAIPAIDRAYIDRWVEIAPGSWERLEREQAKGKGVIFLAGHFGNWEFVPLTGALHGFPTMVLAREQGLPRLNRLLTSYRESKGCKVITKGFPIREMIRGLEQGKIVGIVADQDGGRNGVLAPFFGRLTSTAPGAIVLNVNTGVPVIPVFMVRTGGPAHRLELGEPLTIPEKGTLEERVQQGVAAYVNVVEKYVRKYPSQWLWLHRRWKSCPQRRILLLTDGKAGHLNQLKALAQKIEQAWNLKTRDDKRLIGSTEPLVSVVVKKVEFKHSAARVVLTAIAGLSPKRFPAGDFWLKRCLTRESYEGIRSLHADIAISCGASTAGVNLLWSWGINARAVHILRTAWPSWKKFHLAVVPRHDMPSAGQRSNLILIDGALSLERENLPQRQEEWRQRLRLAKPWRIGLLLGGPARGIDLPIADLRSMLEGILSAAEQLDAELLVTSSRRTSREAEALLEQILSKEERCRLLVLVNRNEPGGLAETSEAVPCILEMAQTIVVSGDSISMVSEAAAHGRQVVSFLPRRKAGLPSAAGWPLRGPKHERFLKQMGDGGHLTLTAPGAIGGELIRLGNGGSPVTETVSVVDPVVEKLIRWL